MKKLVYYSLLLLALLIVVRALLPQRSNTEMDIAAFGQLPVQVGGRIKPLDTVARNTLLILSGRQKVVTREGQTLAPIVWLMDLTMRPELADSYPIFKIEFPDDLGFAGLAQKGERYYSFNELKPHFEKLHKAYSKINKEAKQRTAYEKQIAELNDGLSLYHRVLHALHPIADSARLDRLSDEYQSYQALANGAGMAELRKQQAGEPYDAERLNQFIFYADDYLKLNKIAYLDPVPPAAAASEMDDWKNIGLALLDVMKGEALSPVVTRYGSMIMAYRSNDVERFNQDLAAQTEYFADNEKDQNVELYSDVEGLKLIKPLFKGDSLGIDGCIVCKVFCLRGKILIEALHIIRAVGHNHRSIAGDNRTERFSFHDVQ